MRKKDSYVMMKRAAPKRVTLSDSRTFVARYKRVSRKRSLPHIKIKEGTEAHLLDKGVGE